MRKISRGKRAHLLALCGVQAKPAHRRNAFRKRTERASTFLLRMGRAMAEGLSAGIGAVRAGTINEAPDMETMSTIARRPYVDHPTKSGGDNEWLRALAHFTLDSPDAAIENVRASKG